MAAWRDFNGYKILYRVFPLALLCGLLVALSPMEPVAGDDSAVLLQFKASMRNCNTTIFGSWDERLPMSQWEGVAVSAQVDAVVANLSLGEKGLCGPLPEGFAQLASLTGVNMSGNFLTGAVPNSWSKLTALTGLWLYNNYLNGTLPQSWGSLLRLEMLALGGNWFGGGLPESWGNMCALRHLRLDTHNTINGSLPARWSTLTSLTELNLDNNQVSGTLPAAWSELRNLTFFNMEQNLLTGTLPPSWSNLEYLATLGLKFNKLTGPLPDSWSQMKKLMYMFLTGNALEGTLPATWADLEALQNLSLDQNNLSSSLPDAWSQLRALTGMWMYSNRLHGSLPEAWTQMPSLLHIDLHNNSLSSQLPSTWSEMKTLTVMIFSWNALTGTLPGGWSKMTQLRELYLTHNQLHGTLPESWGQIELLNSLAVDQNMLTGTLPNAYSQLTHMTGLYLYSNKLHGSLPDSWSQMPLCNLYLFRNTLTGTLPVAWAVLPNLTALGLHNNALNGPLPKEWSTLINLKQLQLTSNSFTGPLPPKWTALDKLDTLSVRNNRLEGPIPAAWLENATWWDRFAFLDFASNSFTGPLPHFPASITYFNASSNAFQGSIAPHIPASLVYLHLSRNLLTGPVPSVFPSSSLAYINLDRNQLAQLPQVLRSKALSYVSMAQNQFQGTLPSDPLAYDHSISYMDLSRNQLSGAVGTLWSDKDWVWLALDGNRLTSVGTNASSTERQPSNSAAGQGTGLDNPLGGNNKNSESGKEVATDEGNAADGGKAIDGKKRRGKARPASETVWLGNVTVLLLHNNLLAGPLPEVWPSSAAVRILVFASNPLKSLPASWGRAGQFPNLMVLDVSKTTVKTVPLEWMQKNSFSHNAGSTNQAANPGQPEKPRGSGSPIESGNPGNGIPNQAGNPSEAGGDGQTDGQSNNGTSVDLTIRLGSLWVACARDREWRQTVCMDKDLDRRLKAYLSNVTVDGEVLGRVQNMLNRVLETLNGTLTTLRITASFDVGELPLRLENVTKVTRQDVCDNPRAPLIVILQWTLLLLAVLIQFGFYYAEMDCRLVSRSAAWVHVKLQSFMARSFCSRTRYHHMPLSQQNVQSGGNSVLASHEAPGGVISESNLASGRKAALLLLYSEVRQTMVYGVSFLLYWLDVVTDVLVMVQVWGFWPFWILIGVFALNYMLMLMLVVMRLRIDWRLRVLLAIVGLPFMPLMDLLMFVLLMGNQHVTHFSAVDSLAVQWQKLFDVRAVMEVCAEAIPTSILQSVVFLLGNRPSVGMYLDEFWYVLSAVGSSAQILRLLAVILWEAATSRPHKPPWAVFGEKVASSFAHDPPANNRAHRVRKYPPGTSTS